MTWQLAAFAILLIALAGGFAWYERTRPDARMVALVATLAAFATLGRIAFAAVPNVKPTTDIVLISGYALGPGPGFAVGALGGLTSNFFFGQGPWTPWQMAAWGATGLLGAGLGILSRRHARRMTLALVCATAGFAFTVVQDIGDWVTYSDHSTVQLGAYVGKGIGFDVVHGVGCLTFALAFGPALARSIRRFAIRLHVTWKVPSGTVTPLALALVLAGALSAAQEARSSTPQASYLIGVQNPDGGLGVGPGQPSESLYSGWAALGLASVGVNPRSVTRSGHSLTDYILGGAGSNDPGDLERNILALSAAGISPRRAGGHDLVAELQARIRPDGSVSDQTNLTAFAVLALRAAGVTPPGTTLSWLARQQDSDGGFNYGTAGGASDIDDTGAVLEALAGSGDAGAVGRAIRFLRGQENSDGGFPSSPGQDSNAQSTAWTVQGLVAVGVDPGTFDPRGPSPLEYLQSLVAADGRVSYSRTNNQTPVWVTAQAMMALASRALPIGPVPSAARSPTRSHPARRLRAGSAHRARPAPRRNVAMRRGGAGIADRLASDTGILIALTLAPLGEG